MVAWAVVQEPAKKSRIMSFVLNTIDLINVFNNDVGVTAITVVQAQGRKT